MPAPTMIVPRGPHVEATRPANSEPTGALVQDLRERFGGPFIVNSGFGSVTSRDEAIALVLLTSVIGVVLFGATYFVLRVWLPHHAVLGRPA